MQARCDEPLHTIIIVYVFADHDSPVAFALRTVLQPYFLA